MGDNLIVFIVSVFFLLSQYWPNCCHSVVIEFFFCWSQEQKKRKKKNCCVRKKSRLDIATHAHTHTQIHGNDEWESGILVLLPNLVWIYDFDGIHQVCVCVCLYVSGICIYWLLTGNGSIFFWANNSFFSVIFFRPFLFTFSFVVLSNDLFFSWFFFDWTLGGRLL